MKIRGLVGCLWLVMLAIGCGGGGNVAEKIAQIRVWEDQGWTANGRLVTMLSDRNETVRERAAYALGRVDDTLALDSLRRVLLEDESPKVRAAAAFAFGVWTWKLGTGALLEAQAQEKDPDVLCTILGSLARVYAREEYEQYLPDLHHPDPRVRAQVALTLDMVNRRDMADSIIPLLKDPDEYVRRTALFALGRMGSSKAAMEGEQFAGDPDPEIRALAYRLIGSARHPRRNELILQGARDPDPRVRIAAADAMMVMRDTSVIQAVLPDLAHDPDVGYIQRVLRSLVEHVQADARDYVLPLMSHPDPTIRAMAVAAICNRRDLSCWKDVVQAETDPDWRVRAAIFDLITKTVRFYTVDTAVIRPVAERLTDDPAPQVRAKALQAYFDFGGPDWAPILNRHFHDTSSYVVAQAVNLIGSRYLHDYTDSLHHLYQRVADDPNPDVKWAIAAAGANLLPRVQIDSIRQDIINWGMADPNRLVRWYTIAVAFKFRQDRRSELGIFQTDLTVANIDSLLPSYTTPPLARIETTRGAITIELNTEWAPRTVRKFIQIAQSGAYDNTPVNDLQGGQIVVLGDRYGDESNLPPADVRDELSPLPTEAGTVLWSMMSRNAGRGNFMISLARLPYQDWRYGVFGQVREGMDIARSLTLVDTVRTIQILPAGVS